ncbi:MAG: hypothetical protein A3F54_02150 [Candidatus Kerfeldbacteria bacterium RIFCSPHIGHO2_12_FULL_48_17]|uniref:Integrase catalytic domain-containing protein n=1 Tax=Candidatus Kerfeldbacteria bacterium RIFCSPHIGHO2_12_FULL_48_17 TaxID=1798542 RepID=A0A1G2AX16_9BACT|nr:MAG: hypothetical protein A3F54_02150 [Candidatus Kerfeldbacteria bacterium RIFCSPHIGHO2_12_FULL_48_17]
MTTRKEYLQSVKLGYHTISRQEQGLILSEVVQRTGLNRKYVIRIFAPRHVIHVKPVKQVRLRGRIYPASDTLYLYRFWKLMDYPCGVRLQAAIGEIVLKVKQFQEMNIPDEVSGRLLKISPRTIDERLRKYKQERRRKIMGTTKPGSLLKKQIPIQTSSWEEKRPGFGELDTVAHCGESAGGEFIVSLGYTDISSQWTEYEAVVGKAQKNIQKGIDTMETRLPFRLRGIDPDNGSEFINWALYQSCQKKKIVFTRGRPYHKNDNAHIEQKNWTHVRQLFGNKRRTSQKECDLMNDLYRNEWRLYKNFFQPNLKLIKKIRYGKHHDRIKNIYDGPQTPYQRLLKSPQIQKEKKQQLKALYETLNPFELKRQIEKKLDRINRIRTTPHKTGTSFQSPF